MSSTLDPAKLKVADLRNELSARGLDVKGTKPVLVKRLKDALDKETEGEVPDTSVVDNSTEEAEDPPAPRKSLRGSTDEREEVKTSKNAPAVTPPGPEKPKQVVKTPEKPSPEKKPAAPAPQVKTPVKVPEQPKSAVKTPEQPKPAVKTTEQPKPVVKTAEQPKPVAKTSEQPKPVVKTPEQSKSAVKTPEKPKTPVKSPEKAKVEVKSPAKPQTQAKSPEKPKAPEAKEKGEGDSASKKAKLEQENGEQETKMEVQEESEKPAGEEEKPKEGHEKGKDGEHKGEKRKRSSDSPEPERAHKRAKSPVKEDEPEINAEAVQLSWYDSDLHLEVDKTTFLSAKPLTDGAFGYVWAGARASHGVSTGKVCYEVKVTEKMKWEESPPRPERDNREPKYKTDHRRDRRDDKKNQKNSESAKSDSEKPKESSKTNEDPEKKDENADNKEDDAKAPADDNKSESADKAEETAAKADEPMDTAEVDEKKVEENGEKKDDEKMEDDKDKKEDDKDKKEDDKDKKEDDKDKEDAKDKKEDDEDDKDKKEKVEEPPLPTHFIRIGWSIASASLQLGEDKHSYSYESSGKAVKENEFSDYGVTFDAGDVVGAFLDISATTVTLQFTVNGQVQPSLQIAKADLPEDFVLYPHVLTRNYAFELNFGEQEEPWFAVPSELAGYQFISKVENKVVGRGRPEARSDCEVLLMCGLPASGKTQWIKEHISSNLDKNYTVLGISGLFERMKVAGEPLRPKYKGRWSTLLDRLSKCLNRLISMAALRRRNYIIDQTNVFPSAQRRKMRPFEGFKRKAVIVVNGDEEQARRQALQEATDGKALPDSTLLEMKAAMGLPEVGDWLEEIIYVGSTEEEAKEIIKAYNAAGKAAGYGSERRFSKDRWNYNRRNDYRGRPYQRQGGGGGYNRQPYPQNRWGGAPRQGGGGSGGGWKQDSRSRDYRSGGSSSGGGYERRDRDYYSQSSYSGRSQQQSRPQGGGQRWGGSSGGGWSGQGSGGGGGWNQQTFGGGGGGGSRNYGQGGWGGQSGGQGGWGGKYGSSGSGGGGQGGYGYNNWNYYGQQQQNWSGQGQLQQQQQPAQSGYATGQAQTQGQYAQAYNTQEAWAQYAKQYAQHQQVAQYQAAAAAAAQKR